MSIKRVYQQCGATTSYLQCMKTYILPLGLNDPKFLKTLLESFC